MPVINDTKLDEEFNFDKEKVVQDKFKTTDVININFTFCLKVIKI